MVIVIRLDRARLFIFLFVLCFLEQTMDEKLIVKGNIFTFTLLNKSIHGLANLGLTACGSVIDAPLAVYNSMDHIHYIIR